jgi:radical SAM superfamily enzyme YgiQ (UPF0313 family)
MADIILTTLNAKYIHCAFGLRYLLANLGPLRSRAAIVEFDIHERPVDIAEALLAQNPKIIGLGVYIWNVAPATELVATLKRIRPEVAIILGGPEVSYEVEGQQIVQLADYVITGEADLKFGEVCGQLLTGERPTAKNIAAEPPDFAQLALPYDLYNGDDLANRIIYVEASRGCPFNCEFCLSSLDIPVRHAALPAFLAEMQKLLDRGARQFKFVDRTFNLNIPTSCAILEFILRRHQAGNFYHFEMIPDRLPVELRKLIVQYPAGALQFEVGIQTFNPEVAVRIQRRQDYQRLEDNFRFLCEQTGVHIHADLIFGLPGESLESFAGGFDRLVALGPQEIQVGILKRLRGIPIVRHDAEWQMIYNPHPPYEILQNKLIDFATTQRLRRFARYWNLVGNSGNFVETVPLIWSGFGVPPSGEASDAGRTASTKPAEAGTPNGSPFHAFMRLSDWLYARVGRTDSIALMRLMELLFEFLTSELKLNPTQTAEVMQRDYLRGNRHDVPGFLKNHLQVDGTGARPRRAGFAAVKRQTRHLAG